MKFYTFVFVLGMADTKLIFGNDKQTKTPASIENKTEKSYLVGFGANLFLPGVGLCYAEKQIPCYISSGISVTTVGIFLYIFVKIISGGISGGHGGGGGNYTSFERSLSMGAGAAFGLNWIYAQTHTVISIYQHNKLVPNSPEQTSLPINSADKSLMLALAYQF